MRARRSDDNAQLMMLAGIVLTISFILTALTLSQVSALEREAAGQAPLPIISEWRFLHDRLGSNLNTAVAPETTIASLRTSILPTVQATFRSVESEKGYDLVLRLAGGATYATPGNEEKLINTVPEPDVYEAWTWDGRTHFTHTVPTVSPYSDREDGVVWQVPCPDASGPLAGCVGGVYVHVTLTDGTATMSESILFATNRP